MQVEDEDSIFACYRRLIRLRKEYPVFVDGEFRMLAEEDEDIFSYTRTDGDFQLLVICNFYGRTVKCPVEVPEEGMELLIGNYNMDESTVKMADGTMFLRPYEARMYLKSVPGAGRS